MDPDQPLKKGEEGYDDWVILSIRGLRESLDHSYRQLLDVLHEMPDIVAKLGRSVDELPDFTTVCSRKQDLEMRVWRRLLHLSADIFDTGEIQAIDSTSIAHCSSSRNYAKRVKDALGASKPRFSSIARREQFSMSTARRTSHTTHKSPGKS